MDFSCTSFISFRCLVGLTLIFPYRNFLRLPRDRVIHWSLVILYLRITGLLNICIQLLSSSLLTHLSELDQLGVTLNMSLWCLLLGFCFCIVYAVTLGFFILCIWWLQCVISCCDMPLLTLGFVLVCVLFSVWGVPAVWVRGLFPFFSAVLASPLRVRVSCGVPSVRFHFSLSPACLLGLVLWSSLSPFLLWLYDLTCVLCRCFFPYLTFAGFQLDVLVDLACRCFFGIGCCCRYVVTSWQ